MLFLIYPGHSSERRGVGPAFQPHPRAKTDNTAAEEMQTAKQVLFAGSGRGAAHDLRQVCFPSVGSVRWTRDQKPTCKTKRGTSLGLRNKAARTTKPKPKAKPKTFYERKTQNTDGWSSVGPPVGRQRDCTKSSQKGVLGGGSLRSRLQAHPWMRICFLRDLLIEARIIWFRGLKPTAAR
jgi:hypothetical protein